MEISHLMSICQFWYMCRPDTNTCSLWVPWTWPVTWSTQTWTSDHTDRLIIRPPQSTLWWRRTKEAPCKKWITRIVNLSFVSPLWQMLHLFTCLSFNLCLKFYLAIYFRTVLTTCLGPPRRVNYTTIIYLFINWKLPVSRVLIYYLTLPLPPPPFVSFGVWFVLCDASALLRSKFLKLLHPRHLNYTSFTSSPSCAS